MNGPKASVIIVSRDRPEALCRCLSAVSQLQYHPFEIVVIADRAGLDAVRALDFGPRVKLGHFDAANISKARNLGVALAAGQIVAFIDDDAVPEPAWLHHLTQPFSDDAVAAAGGFVRGSNGISFQCRAKWIDVFGYAHEIPIEGDAPVVLAAQAGRAINTQGTNCAFRREVLAAMGGFDPAYHYYLDETDLNMRLTKRGAATAIVPLAEVHHATAASSIRRANRMPTSLYEIGASQMVYLRKFAPAGEIDGAMAGFRDAHRRTLLRHMVAGNCAPGDIDRVLRTLAEGLEVGRNRPLPALPPIADPAQPFQALHQQPPERRHIVMRGFKIRARRLRRQAAEAVRNGDIVTLFVLSRTTRFHRLRYRDGYWEQSGGLFGKSDRTDPLWCFRTLAQRMRREMGRIAFRRDPANHWRDGREFAKSDV